MPAARRIGTTSTAAVLATLKKGFNDEMPSPSPTFAPVCILTANPLFASVCVDRCCPFPPLCGLMLGCLFLWDAVTVCTLFAKFCGKVLFTNDGNYKYAEWIGTCVQGRCQVCGDFGAASVKYPNAVCGDRICVAGHFAEAVALNFSWEYFSHNPLIISSFLTFVVIAITSCFGTVHACIQMYKRMKKAKRKEGGGGGGEMRA